jgi:hypothetical protein
MSFRNAIHSLVTISGVEWFSTWLGKEVVSLPPPSPKNWACELPRTQFKQLASRSRSLIAHHWAGAPGLRLPGWVSNFSPGRALVSSLLRLATRPRQHPFRLGITLSDRLWIPCAFRLSAFASWPSCPARASAPPYDEPTANGRPYRGFHVPHRQDVSGELASRRREPGTASACSLTMLTFTPGRTSQPRSSPFSLRRFQ